MDVAIGAGGIHFWGEMCDGARRYCLGSNAGMTASFRREDLVHLREHASPFDRIAETDAVYDGPRFSAKRTTDDSGNIGVRLSWSDESGERSLFFQGAEWNLFLQMLDSVCASERAA